MALCTATARTSCAETEPYSWLTPGGSGGITAASAGLSRSVAAVLQHPGS
jgi:hypothetical protein